MAILDRLARAFGYTRQAERRDAGIGSMIGYGPPFAGSFMSAPYFGGRSGAENVACVCACVDVISSALASLPALIYERLPDGNRRDVTETHPVGRLIRQPNHLQSWPDLVRFIMGSVLLYGNALMTIEHDGAGQPVSLSPLPWWNAQPILVPSQPSEAMGPLAPSARLAFDTLRTIAPWGGTGVPRRYFADEVFYLRERSDTGVLGSSRLQRAPLVLQQALAVQGFATHLWDNVATPNLALTHPGKLSKEASDRMAVSWAANHAGPTNARKVIILEEGVKPEPLAVSPEDAEVLESRRFGVEEIARLFGVPPPMIGDWTHATFSNTASANSWFGSNTLLPWCRAIEAEFARAVFNDPQRFHLELDLSGLLRGDYSTQMGVGIAGVRAGIFTPNEVREQQGFNPHPEGDRLQPQSVGGAPGDPGQAGGNDGDLVPPKPNGAGGPGIRPSNGRGSGAA
jgi:HK97 family phage portal protein